MTAPADVNPSAAAPKTSAAPTLSGVIAYLTVDGAAKAAAFYKRAFEAAEVRVYPPDEQGRTMHIHLSLNGGSLMLSDAFPEHGHPLSPPQSFSLMMPVDDVDAWWDRALAAGAEAVMPPQDMFWGDRYAQLRDPFGVLWALDGPLKQA
jgi:uncharacterized glyoxalase superfamily protein PhnB